MKKESGNDRLGAPMNGTPNTPKDFKAIEGSPATHTIDKSPFTTKKGKGR